jgi:hypothetical protein
MHQFVKKMAPVLSVAVLGGASLAYAGSSADSAYCYKNTDGSGACYGNFRGFRGHAGANTYAYFYKSDAGSKFFYGGYTNTSTNVTTYVSCTADASTAAMWSKAIAHESYFSISWNSSGSCYNLHLSNDSRYASY